MILIDCTESDAARSLQGDVACVASSLAANGCVYKHQAIAVGPRPVAKLPNFAGPHPGPLALALLLQ